MRNSASHWLLLEEFIFSMGFTGMRLKL